MCLYVLVIVQIPYEMASMQSSQLVIDSTRKNIPMDTGRAHTYTSFSPHENAEIRKRSPEWTNLKTLAKRIQYAWTICVNLNHRSNRHRMRTSSRIMSPLFFKIALSNTPYWICRGVRKARNSLPQESKCPLRSAILWRQFFYCRENIGGRILCLLFLWFETRHENDDVMCTQSVSQSWHSKMANEQAITVSVLNIMKKCPKKSSAFKIAQRSHLHVMAHVIIFVISRSITYCFALLRGKQPNFFTLTWYAFVQSNNRKIELWHLLYNNVAYFGNRSMLVSRTLWSRVWPRPPS